LALCSALQVAELIFGPDRSSPRVRHHNANDLDHRATSFDALVSCDHKSGADETC
jgi:hypothetical protein